MSSAGLVTSALCAAFLGICVSRVGGQPVYSDPPCGEPGGSGPNCNYKLDGEGFDPPVTPGVCPGCIEFLRPIDQPCRALTGFEQNGDIQSCGPQDNPSPPTAWRIVSRRCHEYAMGLSVCEEVELDLPAAPTAEHPLIAVVRYSNVIKCPPPGPGCDHD
jgi:hypothetical protein